MGINNYDDKYDKAGDIVNTFHEKTFITKKDDRDLINACKTLMEIDDHPWLKSLLAEAYARNNRYDLVKKIYEEMSEMKEPDEEDIDHRKPFISFAHLQLGDLYKTGYLGYKDYEKAFFHFTIGANLGDLRCIFEIAEFHRDGIIVKKDNKMYVELLEYVYAKIDRDEEEDDQLLIATCNFLAKEYYKAGKENEGFKILQEGIRAIKKEFLYEGGRDYQYIREIVGLYFKIKGLNSNKLDFLSLYEVFKKPCKIGFTYENKKYKISAFKDGTRIYLLFNEKRYKNFEDFYEKVKINDESLIKNFKKVKNIQYI